jgi:hypothetical protein
MLPSLSSTEEIIGERGNRKPSDEANKEDGKADVIHT